MFTYLSNMFMINFFISGHSFKSTVNKDNSIEEDGKGRRQQAWYEKNGIVLCLQAGVFPKNFVLWVGLVR